MKQLYVFSFFKHYILIVGKSNYLKSPPVVNFFFLLISNGVDL